MAVLEEDWLALEWTFRRGESGLISDNVRFLINGDPIIRDEVLKRHNEYWDNRDSGAVLVDDGPDPDPPAFIDLIDGVLASGEPNYFVAMDPDVAVSLYPGEPYPF